MNESSNIPGWMRGALVAGLCGWLLWRELRRPARRSVESKFVRNARNLAVAGLGGLAVQFAEMPVALGLCAFVQDKGWGLLQLLSLPGWLEITLAVLALDYTLYHWHVLTHRQALLWRFHLPHHADLDMDASTALRFHFGEIGLSVGWRAAQIAVIGVSPLAFSIWQTFLILCILFHHSNVRLSPRAEGRLGWVLVTPTMHAIHHSNIQEETNSNWSSGLSLWDRLHGTLRLDVPLDALTIGVPAYSRPEDVTLPRVLKMPFGAQRPAWQLPDGALRLTRDS
jgi:sterol desaturase/sphingolipid hydroxylase (fatty acid hydroxylase superfamily)